MAVRALAGRGLWRAAAPSYHLVVKSQGPVALLSLLLLAGCQSERAAMKVMCDAPSSCTECVKMQPAMQQQAFARHISERVSNVEMRAMFEALAIMPAAERVELLRETARDKGLSRCAYAEHLAELLEPSTEAEQPAPKPHPP